jgi:hypothetical protein
MIIGLALGDLYIRRVGQSVNTQLCFEGSIKLVVYIRHLFFIFACFCASDPVIRLRTTSHFISFTTLVYPVFNYFRDLFYVNGVKIVPLNIGDLLTPRALAYWFMYDGYRDLSGFVLCPDSFTLAEVLLLMFFKLNLIWTALLLIEIKKKVFIVFTLKLILFLLLLIL